MNNILRVSSGDLQRAATANTAFLDVARNLAELAEKESDPSIKAKLYEQIDKILGTSKTIADAVTSAVRSVR